MISLKKYIEHDREKLQNAALAAYRSALDAMGNSGALACPALGDALRENLSVLLASLSAEPTAGLLQETEQRLGAELQQWGNSAANYSKHRVQEVKELLLILARTSEVIGDRDQRYATQLQEFTGRLQTVADLEDLAEIRGALVVSAAELKSCARDLADESQKSLAELRKDLDGYQARLDDAEQLARLDPLTGLENRRRIEAAIESRIGLRRPFSILILDLNGFKNINDSHGHLAGDDLLRQFASELKLAFRAADVVGRWGGDEFVVVMDEGPQQAEERVSRRVFGEYKIGSAAGTLKIPVDAAMGLAVWQPGDTLRSLIERADSAMYDNKRSRINILSGIS
jgi:diguanylate cyclase (GGDEF)-like protein